MHRELKVRTAQKNRKKVPKQVLFFGGGGVSEPSSSFELSLWESFIGHHHSMPFQFLSLLTGRTYYHVTFHTASGCPRRNIVSASANCISACHNILLNLVF